MADEKDLEEETKAEEAPKKSNKKLYIIIATVVVLVLAAGVPFLLRSKGPVPEAELEEGAAQQIELEMEGANDEDELIEGEEPLGAIFPLETFVVNLAGDKYIRVQIQLEFVNRDVSRRFYSRLVPIRDNIITLLSSKKSEDLKSAKDKEALKTAIKDTINGLLRREEVKKVYFSQFIVQ